MNLAVPSQLAPANVADAVGSATATGVEVAGHLLHEVGQSLGSAAASTTDTYRKWARSARRQPASNKGRNLAIGAIALALIAAVLWSRWSKAADAEHAGAPTGDADPSTSATNGFVRRSPVTKVS